MSPEGQPRRAWTALLARPWSTPALIAAASFAAVAWIPILSDSPYADISGWYTDHLHHSFATWVFLKRGLLLYTRPLGALSDGAGWPFRREDWGNMPMAYPPGVFAVFLPLVAAGKLLPLSEQSFAVLGILYVLLLTHLALFAVLRALQALPPGSRSAVAVFLWMILIHMGLEGFYDAAFIGCGAWAITRLKAQDPGSALRWLGLAALLHFRAVVFLPLGLAVLVGLVRGTPRARWPWRSLVWVGAASLVCAATFLLMVPATASFRANHPRILLEADLRAAVVAALGAGALGVALWGADRWVAASVAVCLGLACVEIQDYWWHAAVLFVPALLVGVVADPRHASVSRALLLGWACCTMPLVWRDQVTDLFPELVKNLSLDTDGQE